MILLSLLLAGVAVGALTGVLESSDDGTEDETNTDGQPIQRDGIPGLLVEGDGNDETIYATNGPDIVSGEGGDDILRARSGHDYALGGEGDDTIFGQTGEDEIMGGEGNDELHGGRQDDTILGGAGNDTLFGGPGNDELIGADITNRDFEVGDRYTEQDPSGPIFFQEPTEAEANVLDGGDGNDSLLLGEDDLATGGAGADEFYIGYWVEDEAKVPLITDFNAQEDTLTVHYLEGDTPPTITLGTETDNTLVYADGQLVARIQGDTGLTSANEVQISEVSSGADEATTETLTLDGVQTSVQYASNSGDTLRGDTGADILVGAEGDDSLRGEGGNDIIHGFAGDDFISGGDGDDFLVGSQGADTLKGNDGEDFIDGTALFTSAEFLDALYDPEGYGGQIPLEFGAAPVSEDGDVIKGGAGDDTIRVGTDDTVSGNEGSDTFLAAGWITPGSPAIITDFNPSEDVLSYQHYRQSEEDPVIEIRDSADGHAELLVDGQAMVVLRDAAGTITLDNVVLTGV